MLPGLVNAHTHLEFSDCRTPIGDSGISLSKWIGLVIQSRSTSTRGDTVANVATGIQESQQAGVRLIGEITTPPMDYRSIDTGETQLVCFAEVLGLSQERANERLQSAIKFNGEHSFAAWSPHAPYSTSRQTIQACVDRARQTNRSIAMHVAESPAERELLTSGTGGLAESLKSLGVWDDTLFPWPTSGGHSPFVDLIEHLAAAPRALLVHCNDLRSDEIDTVAQHDNLSIVVCPRTHAFFGYDQHPIAEMLTQGIRIALGTDSRASNPDLDLWREVQHLLNHRSDIDPMSVVAMATTNGAIALRHDQRGSIEIGKSPGLGMVATESTSLDSLACDLATQPYGLLTDHS